MKKILLHTGEYTLVDDKDFGWLNQWKWYKSTNGYALRNIHKKIGFKQYKNIHIRMHRLIIDAPKNKFTDHINHNKLDNRRSNLRTVNKSQNEHNTDKRRNNTTGYLGVFKGRNKYMARITINGKHIYGGFFKDVKEAALARDKIALKYHGEFARLNFPKGTI